MCIRDSVHALRVPAERLVFARQIAQLADLADRPVDLALVVIRKRDQVGQLVLRREKRGLPYLALLALAVADDQVGCLLYTSRCV